ncbi:metal ABC transporter substrate-binding protein [Corynebacterium bovis]|uniref:metal ABC transporter substrate-binding protein n=4 Tax=Corynebacterium bovis TaxID=36808 RepID=UPI0016398D13|nr:metal ABC transporter substrate-binding protein [Corynebacterium bovis]
MADHTHARSPLRVHGSRSPAADGPRTAGGRRGRRAGTRVLAGTLAAALAAGALVACGTGDGSTSGAGDRPTVLATFTILADMTREIAGDDVEVTSLTRPGAEVHGYDPSPHDIAAAHDADVIVANGLGLEHWLDTLTADSDAPRVTASDGVTPIPIEGSDDPNPHAWMSPRTARTYVDNIVRGLSEHIPSGADGFRQRGEAYARRLDTLQADMETGLSALPRTERVLVSCEGAFSYLARDAGLREGYIWPVNADGEITPDQIRRAADIVRDNHVPAVFCESTVDQGPKQQLMRETGARDGGTLYVDSLTEADGAAPTYLDLVHHDTTTIVEGLTGRPAEARR